MNLDSCEELAGELSGGMRLLVHPGTFHDFRGTFVASAQIASILGFENKRFVGRRRRRGEVP